MRRLLSPGVALWSVGGPTETSVMSNWYRIGEVDPIWTTIPYGRAMLNQKMLVLDSGLNHCPPFMPGRIFMGGVCLARGYWKDPEKTDAAFITWPVTGERIYYTGDLGRWLPDGQVEFLGRADFQVKVNGFRVELGEIEGAIQALPGVKAVIVDGQDQPNHKGKFLVAYVVSEGGLDAAQMRAALQDRLPYYMIPRIFVPLERIPLSANGKVDRRALPRPDVAQMPGELPYVAPRTPTEAALVDIWQAVLKHQPIGIHDNFYSLGGDSLLGVQIGVKAREAGLRFDPTALQRTPTIAELVEGLEPAPTVRMGDATGDVPLSPMQRYYFTWATVRPQQFNTSAVFRCSVEPERLRAALAKLVAYYDSLRLRFKDGRQFYAEEGLEIPLECADLPLAEVGARAAQMQETLDIANGPIMRAALFTTEQGQRLVLICHHLVTDGLAWGAAVTDLQRLYLGQALAGPVGPDIRARQRPAGCAAARHRHLREHDAGSRALGRLRARRRRAGRGVGTGPPHAARGGPRARAGGGGRRSRPPRRLVHHAHATRAVGRAGRRRRATARHAAARHRPWRVARLSSARTRARAAGSGQDPLQLLRRDLG
jgi:hypothetical protein